MYRDIIDNKLVWDTLQNIRRKNLSPSSKNMYIMQYRFNYFTDDPSFIVALFNLDLWWFEEKI